MFSLDLLSSGAIMWKSKLRVLIKLVASLYSQQFDKGEFVKDLASMSADCDQVRRTCSEVEYMCVICLRNLLNKSFPNKNVVFVRFSFLNP